jgi:uncharacterized OB-fold protein
MPSTNDITGARLVSKANTPDYDDNYDRIFRKETKLEVKLCNNCGEANDSKTEFCEKCGQTF